MSVVGPAERYLYVFDPTANLGVDLTATDGQVGEFASPTINTTLDDRTGSASRNPVLSPTGHEAAEDTTIPIWADSTLQELIDDWVGTTASDRRNARLIVTGWYAADAIGALVDFGKAYLKKVAPMTPQAMLTKLATTWTWDGLPMIGAEVLHPLSEETADGDTEADSIDGGSSSSDGGWGAWGYTALDLDGGTAFAPRIIDSADDITYGSLIAFTAVTATTGGGQVPTFVAGTIERYVASDWDFTGTPGGSEACTFWIAFKRL